MTLTSQKQVTQDRGKVWLAMRIACGRCASHKLEPIQQNLVECSDCHTKQWSILNMQGDEKPPPELESPGIIKSFLICLGFPQRAFVRYIPAATQFFWFRCIKCKKISTDYLHGYSSYFICRFCQSEIRAL